MSLQRPLLIAVTVQFGCHFAKNIAPLKSFFSSDPDWSVTANEWALFQSAVTLPCIFFPWMLGRSVDSNPIHVKKILVAALVMVCIGQITFILAVHDHWFSLCLVGRFVFGVGEGLVSSLAGYIAAAYVPGHRMLSIGLTQAFHALAVASSKAILAPIANYYNNYIYALAWALLTCIVSLLAGVLWGRSSGKLEKAHPARCSSLSRRIVGNSLPLDFWLVTTMHLLFSSAHRLFGHIDASFLGQYYGESASRAGMASSITEFVAVFLSPILGALLDNYCTRYTLPRLLLGAAILGSLGYGMLGFNIGRPSSAALVMIGVVNGIVSTVMKSLIPECVESSAMATAFGIYESSESIGITAGSILVGRVAERARDDYSSVVPVFSGLLAIAAVLASVLVIRRTRKQSRNCSEGLDTFDTKQFVV